MADNKIEIKIAADNIEEVKAEMESRITKALTAMGIQASSHAKVELQNTPSRIDTGLLRNSITYALDGGSTAINGYSASNASKYNGKTPSSGGYSGTMPEESKGRQAVYIGTNVEYAEYIHEGFDLPSGKHVAPNRYLKNAVENNLQELADIEKKFLLN